MTKKELIKKIATEGKTSFAEAQSFYEIFEQALFDAITSEGEVILSPSLGKFVLNTIKPQKRPEMVFKVNPNTGERNIVKTGKIIKYPASTVVRFKVSQALKQEVKKINLE